MDFNVITSSLKKGVDAFVSNVVAYIVGFLIMIIGSILIVTIAPLFYGMYYMILKGTRGEKVEIKDIFYGFKSVSMFIRSWIGIIVYVLAIFIVAFVILFIGGLVGAATGSASITLLFSLIAMIAMLILEIFLYFTLYIYVMTPSENIVYAIKESAAIGKANILTVLITIIISGILAFIGGLVFGILALVTGPIAMLFAAYVLKELKPELKDEAGL